MSNPDKPARKPRKLAPKPDQAPGPKAKRAQRPMAAQPPDRQEKVEPAVSPPATVAVPDAVAMRAAAPANAIDFQIIATAYGDYTRKSFELTKSFVEQLAGVRSLDQAIEIQTEFVKQAYETYMTEAQKICELFNGLARQSYEGAVPKEPAAR
jgi:hypothetical protein